MTGSMASETPEINQPLTEFTVNARYADVLRTLFQHTHHLRSAPMELKEVECHGTEFRGRTGGVADIRHGETVLHEFTALVDPQVRHDSGSDPQ